MYVCGNMVQMRAMTGDSVGVAPVPATGDVSGAPYPADGSSRQEGLATESAAAAAVSNAGFSFPSSVSLPVHRARYSAEVGSQGATPPVINGEWLDGRDGAASPAVSYGGAARRALDGPASDSRRAAAGSAGSGSTGPARDCERYELVDTLKGEAAMVPAAQHRPFGSLGAAPAAFASSANEVDHAFAAPASYHDDDDSNDCCGRLNSVDDGSDDDDEHDEEDGAGGADVGRTVVDGDGLPTSDSDAAGGGTARRRRRRRRLNNDDDIDGDAGGGADGQLPRHQSVQCVVDGCAEKFSSVSACSAHQAAAHGGVPEEVRSAHVQYVCDFPACGVTMADHAALGAHQRVHSGARPYACSFPGCGATFAQKSNCTRHMRTHTGERPFVCDVPNCGAAFSQKSSLGYHISVHANHRPFKCNYVPGCLASFPSGALHVARGASVSRGRVVFLVVARTGLSTAVCLPRGTPTSLRVWKGMAGESASVTGRDSERTSSLVVVFGSLWLSVRLIPCTPRPPLCFFASVGA